MQTLDECCTIVHCDCLKLDGDSSAFCEGTPGLVISSGDAPDIGWTGARADSTNMLRLWKTQLAAYQAFWGIGHPAPKSNIDPRAQLMRGAGDKLIVGDADLKLDEKNALMSSVAGQNLMRTPDRQCQCCCDTEANPMCCCIAPGWWSDLWYFTCQYHPFLGIFLHSPQSRLNSVERICIEVSTICLTLCATNIQTYWIGGSGHMPGQVNNSTIFYVVNFIWSYVVFYALWYLFEDPCGITKRGAGACERCCNNICKIILEAFGYLLTVIIIVCTFFLVFVFSLQGFQGVEINDDDVINAEIMAALIARIQVYIYFFGLQILRRFNPWCAWGNPASDYVAGWELRDLLAIGQWRIEKQQFQNRCLDALKYREIQFLTSSNELPDEEAPAQSLMCGCSRPPARDVGFAAPMEDPFVSRVIFSS